MPKRSAASDDSPVDAGMGYRPDIDGLRAVAVLSVFFYHLGFNAFGGGFVGVDVFFVISGFLITRLLRDEISVHRSLNFRRFYLRRVRRIVPAQLVVLIATTITAAAVLAPPHLKSFGAALAATVTSCSNIYFWSEAGYFDAASSTKPLLHTWSLGVEEQFYFLWPAALALALRSGRRLAAPMMLLAAGVTSLAFNAVFASGFIAVVRELGFEAPDWMTTREWLADGPSTIFFLLPFRVFEFAVGALLVWLPAPRTALLVEIAMLAGFSLIGWAVATFDSSLLFPSYHALVPCLGAALCIYSGQSARLGVLLSNRVAVAIGLISYSLYLVHWPLIVFWLYPDASELGVFDSLTIITLTFATAALLYRFVEQPFRNSTSWLRQLRPRTAVVSLLGAASLLFAVAIDMWRSNGWTWRYAGTSVAADIGLQEEDFRSYVWANLRAMERPFSGASSVRMLIVGDSMAADFANVAVNAGLHEEFEIRSIPIRDSCQSILPLTPVEYERLRSKPSCAEQSDRAAASDIWKQADVIVIAFLWNDDMLSLLRRQMAELRRLAPAADFVIVGPKAQEISGINLVARIAQQDPAADLSRYTTRFPDLQRLALSIVRATASDLQAAFFDPTTLFCAEGGCLRFNETGNMLIYDDMHLTPRGAEFLGRRLRQRIAEFPMFDVRTYARQPT